MERKTKIYPISPLVELEINEQEKDEYLSSKFFKNSKKEAIIFYFFYTGMTPHYASYDAIVGILSGDLLETDDIEQTLKNIETAREEAIFRNFDKITNPKYRQIIKAINDKKNNYRKDFTLKQLLDWALTVKLIDKSLEKSLIKEIEVTQRKVFIYPTKFSAKIKTIRHLTSGNFNFINYADAKELLFANIDLIDSIKKAIEKRELTNCYPSDDLNYFYLDFKFLFKWLMKENYISNEIENEFKELKKESLKDYLWELDTPFSSLQKLMHQGYDRNDILQDVMVGKFPIYLKFPRELLKWRDVLRTSDTSIQKRFYGFGQLKLRDKDDSFDCQFGGLSVEKLLFNEKPKYFTDRIKQEYQIEFVSTEIELKYNLQPYINLSNQELNDLIIDSNLIILDQHISSRKHNIKQQKSIPLKKINPLMELIQRIYAESADKSPGAIWKKLQSLADEEDSIILEIDSFTSHKARITWKSHTIKERSLGKRRFSNIISELNQN